MLLLCHYILLVFMSACVCFWKLAVLTQVSFFMVSEFLHADAGMVSQTGFCLLPVLDYPILWCFVVELLIASSVIL